MAKIILEREKCISCGSCAVVCEKYFEMAEDAKTTLKNSIKNKKTGNFELEVKEIGCAKEAVDVCPVQCIRIE